MLKLDTVLLRFTLSEDKAKEKVTWGSFLPKNTHFQFTQAKYLNLTGRPEC